MKNKSSNKSQPEAGKEILEEAKDQAEAPWVLSLERFGFLTRGLIYVFIGFLALKLAIGLGGGATTSPGSAIKLMGQQPFGEVLLIIVSIGLAGYALWGFIRAILDPLRRGNDLDGLIDRAGFLFSGFSYAALLVPTIQTLLNKPASQGSATSLWAKISTGPWGKWVVIGFALFWIAAGIGQLVEGFTARFLRDLKTSRMSEEEVNTATRLGQAGYAARGIVFVMIGVVVLQAVFASGYSQPKGIGDALAAVESGPYGSLLLGIISIGLILFGLYSGLCAKWNRAVNNKHS